MEKPRPAAVAWGVLFSGIAAYEYLAPENELLSEGVDRALETRYKYLVIGAVTVTAAHLLNTFEQLGIEKADPYKLLGKIRRKAKE